MGSIPGRVHRFSFLYGKLIRLRTGSRRWRGARCRRYGAPYELLRTFGLVLCDPHASHQCTLPGCMWVLPVGTRLWWFTLGTPPEVSPPEDSTPHVWTSFSGRVTSVLCGELATRYNPKRHCDLICTTPNGKNLACKHVLGTRPAPLSVVVVYNENACMKLFSMKFKLFYINGLSDIEVSLFS